MTSVRFATIVVLGFAACGAVGATTAETDVVESRTAPRFPRQAQEDGVQGLVKVSISYDADGDVSDASILLEEPKGLGFGDATLQMARAFTFKSGHAGIYAITVPFMPIDTVVSLKTYLALPPAPPRVDALGLPLYPPYAYAQQQNGYVDLQLDIDATGTPTAIKFANAVPGRGASDLADAAIVQAANWRFQAGVAGRYALRIAFDLAAFKASGRPQLAVPLSGALPSLAPPPDLRFDATTCHAHRRGTVVANVTIGPVGVAAKAELVSPPAPGQSNCVIDSLQAAQFSPATPPGVYEVHVTR